MNQWDTIPAKFSRWRVRLKWIYRMASRQPFRTVNYATLFAILLNKIYFHAQIRYDTSWNYVSWCAWNAESISRVACRLIQQLTSLQTRERDDFSVEISIPFLPMNSEYRGERINHVRFGMEVCGWNFACRNRWRRCLFFYAKNKSTPTRTIGIANKVRFFPLGWDTSSAFIVPSIICLFHLREEPTQFSFQMDTHTHTHARGPENGNGDGGEFWKSPPMYFYKGFRSRLPWICMYFCANPDKSYRVTAKIASIYNTSPLEKIEFKSEKKKKKPEFRNDRISPPFFPSSTLYTEIHSRRGSFVNVSLPW